MSPGSEEAQAQSLRLKLEELQRRQYPQKLTYLSELREIILMLGYIQYYTMMSSLEKRNLIQSTALTSIISEVIRLAVYVGATYLAIKGFQL